MTTEYKCRSRLPANTPAGKFQQRNARERHVATGATRPTQYGFSAALPVFPLLLFLLWPEPVFADHATTAAVTTAAATAVPGVVTGNAHNLVDFPARGLRCGCLAAKNSQGGTAAGLVTGAVVRPATTPEFGILAAAAPPIDFLARTYGHYLDWVAGVSDGTFWTMVRLAFTLIVCTTFCGLTFHHLRNQVSRSRLLALQWIASLSALFLCMELPIPSVSIARRAKGIIFAFAWFGILVLPGWRLSWLLTPHAGTRKIIATLMYSAIVVVFLAHFLTT